MLEVRHKPLSRLSAILAILFLLCFALMSRNAREYKQTSSNWKFGEIHLVVVACEGKGRKAVPETITMIKSASMFSIREINIHIYTDKLQYKFEREFSRWPPKMKSRTNIAIHQIRYPLPQQEMSKIRNWWGPCASFRLFLPEILKEADAILYVDTDVIFLGPVEDVWDHFKKFNRIHVGGLAPRVGWDFNVPKENHNFILKPNGKLTQVNSGVFLMNLTRMRNEVFRDDPAISEKLYSWKWEFLKTFYSRHKTDMHGDQNLINAVFHYNPDLLYFLPCKFNYHHKFCFDDRIERTCASAEKEGAAVIHGSANTFYNNYSPAFAAINKAFRQYNFEEDMDMHLFQPVVEYLTDPNVEKHEHCGGKTNILTVNIRKAMSRVNKIRGVGAGK